MLPVDEGLLPEGVHDMSLEDVRQRFGQFDMSDRRPRLFARLVDLIEQVRQTAFIDHVIVDGSFVTGKPDPSDIDLIFAIDTELARNASSARDHNLLSSKRMRSSYQFDVLIAPTGSSAYEEYLDYFLKVKGVPGARKGVVRLRP